MDPFWSWSHLEVILTGAGLFAGIFVPIWVADRRQREKMHEENQNKLNELLSTERFLPQHFHNEKSGPLTAEGLRLKPNGR